MLSESGPHLAMAVFCEKVLQEKDGVLSAIRVIDRLTHTEALPSPPLEMPQIQWTMFALVTLKAGNARGRANLAIRPEQPSGLRMPEVAQSILFEGEDRGINFMVNLQVTFTHEGLYWFDVLLDENVITRMPFRVIYHPVKIGGPM